MNISISKVWFDNNCLCVSTSDGETHMLRLEIFPALYFATEEQRKDFHIWNQGRSIRWTIIDEDICVEDLSTQDTVNYDNEVHRLISQFPYLDLKEFANYIGMHWTKLARYKFGVWTPSEEELLVIRKGLHNIGTELLKAV